MQPQKAQPTKTPTQPKKDQAKPQTGRKTTQSTANANKKQTGATSNNKQATSKLLDNERKQAGSAKGKQPQADATKSTKSTKSNDSGKVKSLAEEKADADAASDESWEKDFDLTDQ